jgi:hypothetical protein
MCSVESRALQREAARGKGFADDRQHHGRAHCPAGCVCALVSQNTRHHLLLVAISANAQVFRNPVDAAVDHVLLRFFLM